MTIIWIIVFTVALALMIKSADWLLEKSEKIGLALGISPFIVGVTIVGAGTSFPELISGLMAVWQGATEIVVANAIGSNVANILLVVGLAAVIGKKIIITKNLINLDLPLLSIATVLVLGVTIDKQVTLIEAIILLIAYVVYLFYTMQDKETKDAEIEKQEDLPDILPTALITKQDKKIAKKNIGKGERPKIVGIDLLMLAAGIIGLFLGSKYLIQSVVELADIFRISAGLIAITAVAIGTSLPELLVSVKAAKQGKAEIAIGNIFGSNVFNLLVVIGIPGLITTLQIDANTFLIGLPTMLLATILFVISSMSLKIYIWEGMMFLLLYIVFIGKLFGLF